MWNQGYIGNVAPTRGYASHATSPTQRHQHPTSPQQNMQQFEQIHGPSLQSPFLAPTAPMDAVVGQPSHDIDRYATLQRRGPSHHSYASAPSVILPPVHSLSPQRVKEYYPTGVDNGSGSGGSPTKQQQASRGASQQQQYQDDEQQQPEQQEVTAVPRRDPPTEEDPAVIEQFVNDYISSIMPAFRAQAANRRYRRSMYLRTTTKKASAQMARSRLLAFCISRKQALALVHNTMRAQLKCNLSIRLVEEQPTSFVYLTHFSGRPALNQQLTTFIATRTGRTVQELTLALSVLPAVIFSNVYLAQAEEIVEICRDMDAQACVRTSPQPFHSVTTHDPNDTKLYLSENGNPIPNPNAGKMLNTATSVDLPYMSWRPYFSVHLSHVMGVKGHQTQLASFVRQALSQPPHLVLDDSHQDTQGNIHKTLWEYGRSYSMLTMATDTHGVHLRKQADLEQDEADELKRKAEKAEWERQVDAVARQAELLAQREQKLFLANDEWKRTMINKERIETDKWKHMHDNLQTMLSRGNVSGAKQAKGKVVATQGFQSGWSKGWAAGWDAAAQAARVSITGPPRKPAQLPEAPPPTPQQLKNIMAQAAPAKKTLQAKKWAGALKAMKSPAIKSPGSPVTANSATDNKEDDE